MVFLLLFSSMRIAGCTNSDACRAIYNACAEEMQLTLD